MSTTSTASTGTLAHRSSRGRRDPARAVHVPVCCCDRCSAGLEKKGLKTDVPVVVLAPGYHGHGIARSLGRLGVPVYGVHADPRSPAARSRYWRTKVIWNLAEARAGEQVTLLLRVRWRDAMQT